MIQTNFSERNKI